MKLHLSRHILAVVLAFSPALVAEPYSITPESYLAHIKFLTSPDLKGRLTGTPELNKAAEYMAARFSEARLQPLGESYFQDFEVTASTGLSDGDRLILRSGGKSKELTQGTDFVPLNLSGNGNASGEIVFAGYG